MATTDVEARIGGGLLMGNDCKCIQFFSVFEFANVQFFFDFKKIFS
jgi:hypothetical protein